MSGGLTGVGMAMDGKFQGEIAKAQGQAQGAASVGSGISGLASGLAGGIGPSMFGGGGGGSFGISRSPSQLNFDTMGAFFNY